MKIMNAWKMNGVDFVQFKLSIGTHVQLGSYYSNSSEELELIHHVKVLRHFYKCVRVTRPYNVLYFGRRIIFWTSVLHP